MIVVDDKLSLDALAGHFDVAETVANTGSFHYRLLRALCDHTWSGAPSARKGEAVHRIAAAPPEDRLVVLDPRVVTAQAAIVATGHQLKLLAAELIASAVHYGAEVQLSARNVGRQWPDVMAAEGITLTIV